MPELFNYRVWDQINGTNVVPPKMATAEFIAAARGEVFAESGREVDPHLVDGNGQAVLAAGSAEERDLLTLYDKGGKASAIGNKNLNPLRNLELMGLVKHLTITLDHVEYEITELGKLAVEQLVRWKT